MKTTAWDRASLGLIACHVVLLLSSWPLLPFFVDIYYHLNVVQAFQDAGGVVLHDFWEFAPLGRPHLYPPALHVALLSLKAGGVSMITLARLAAVMPYPALLLASWWFSRQWFGDRAAYWVSVCGVLPYAYLLVSCYTIAASWAMALWLVGWVALRRQATLALVLCGALVFYTHLGVPWLMVSSWLLLALWHRPFRKPLAIALSGTFALALPWLWHLWKHHDWLASVSMEENKYWDLPLALYVFACVGLVKAWKALPRPESRVTLSFLAGLLPLWAHYRFRFFSGQGLVAVSLLAGLGLDAMQAWMEDRAPKPIQSRGWTVPIFLTLALFILQPTFFISEGKPLLVLGDTSFSNLGPFKQRIVRSNATPFYYPHLADSIVEVIRRQSAPDELIGCDVPYVCGMFAALSGRSMATGMLSEVRPNRSQAEEPLRQAHLILWLKGPPMPGLPPLDQLRREWRLQPLAETDFGYVLRNPQARGKRSISQPVLSLWAAQTLLGLSVAAVAWDFLRRRPPPAARSDKNGRRA